MALTNTAVKNAKPRDKTYKQFDGEGLYLEVRPNSKKHWRLKYRLGGKERLFAIGPYPQFSLAEARDSKRDARALIAKGIDPVVQRRAEMARKAALNITLEFAAREWLELKRPDWVPDHHSKVVSRLDRHILPYLGKRLLGEIEAHEILSCLERIVKRGHVETAHRVRSVCGQIYRYGVVKRWVKSDPCRDLEGALPSYKRKTNHFAAVETPKAFGQLLGKMDRYSGTAPVCLLYTSPSPRDQRGSRMPSSA